MLHLAPIHSPAQALPCPSPLQIKDPDCLSSDDKIPRLPHMTLTGKDAIFEIAINIINRIQSGNTYFAAFAHNLALPTGCNGGENGGL